LTETIKPPAHLSKKAAAYFKRFVAEYDCEDSDIEVLIRICESGDRADQCAAALKKHGSLLSTDRFGCESTFGNVDSYGDTVAPGAFAKTISDAKNGNAPWPAMLSQHGGNDPTPVGIWTGMDEDEHGMKLKGKLAINNKRGANIYALLKMKPRPALNGLSIGYRVRDAENHRSGSGPNGAKRTLKQIDLVECSIVTFPADQFARVASVKQWVETDPVDEAAQWKNLAANE
jgi:hypothetical protein